LSVITRGNSRERVRHIVLKREESERGRGETLLVRVVDLVESGPHSPLAALVKVSPAPMLVR
jgi:hypothetical protein